MLLNHTLNKMGILSSLAICLLAFHQFQSGQARVRDRMRIINGDLASHGEIKYIVVTRHDDQYYNCGGGIIGNYYILSAAHCFINSQNQFGNDKITVVAGIIDINNENDPGRVEVEVEKVYIPKGYQPELLGNDIAVLKLKKSLNITDDPKKNSLEILSLPTVPRRLDYRMAVMAGFGNDEHGIFFNTKTREWQEEGRTSGLLRKAKILLFSNDECQKLYKRNKIDDTNICGKMIKDNQKEEYGICNGDSGGPLVFNSNKNKVVIGVVSWSYGCDEREVPMVYTRVNSFLQFIKDAKNDVTEDMRVKVFE